MLVLKPLDGEVRNGIRIEEAGNEIPEDGLPGVARPHQQEKLLRMIVRHKKVADHFKDPIDQLTLSSSNVGNKAEKRWTARIFSRIINGNIASEEFVDSGQFECTGLDVVLSIKKIHVGAVVRLLSANDGRVITKQTNDLRDCRSLHLTGSELRQQIAENSLPQPILADGLIDAPAAHVEFAIVTHDEPRKLFHNAEKRLTGVKQVYGFSPSVKRHVLRRIQSGSGIRGSGQSFFAYTSGAKRIAQLNLHGFADGFQLHGTAGIENRNRRSIRSVLTLLRDLDLYDVIRLCNYTVFFDFFEILLNCGIHAIARPLSLMNAGQG